MDKFPWKTSANFLDLLNKQSIYRTKREIHVWESQETLEILVQQFVTSQRKTMQCVTKVSLQKLTRRELVTDSPPLSSFVPVAWLPYLELGRDPARVAAGADVCRFFEIGG